MSWQEQFRKISLLLSVLAMLYEPIVVQPIDVVLSIFTLAAISLGFVAAFVAQLLRAVGALTGASAQR